MQTETYPAKRFHGVRGERVVSNATEDHDARAQGYTVAPYVHQDYPAARYHRDGSVITVTDPDHELTVAHPDEGWADTPAAFDTPFDLPSGEPAEPAVAGDEPATAPAKPKRKR